MEDSKPYNIPIAIETISAALSSNIPILSSIYNAYSAFSNHVAHKALRITLIELSNRLSELEQYIVRDSLYSDEFKNFSYKVFLKATEEIRTEKLKLFAQFLAQSVLPSNIGNTDKYLFLETLDKVNLEQLLFIEMLKGDTIDVDYQNTGWTGKEDELKNQGITQERFLFLADYLTNIGLVSRIEKFKVEEGMLYMWREYFVSSYGLSFLSYLKTVK